ncbi:MAG: winged helix-turn-helix transcriptional regulator, partial [Ktedonobacterales bacterium]
ALVLACIREHGPISRVLIAQRTELSRTTVSAIARALLQEGVIREGARSSSTKRGGRRAILLNVTTC